ncbi:MAG: hypothetical protein LBJ43_00530 [Propionibacteriaceae bacterium]|jgi:hypothetical protein|nr:hypothetical protein [Propionibacteriaceae bacterium]
MARYRTPTGAVFTVSATANLPQETINKMVTAGGWEIVKVKKVKMSKPSPVTVNTETSIKE